MNLRTRPAGTGVTHHPEIIGLAAIKNVNRWVEISFAKQIRPVIVRFLVEFTRFTWARFVNGRIQPLRRKLPAFDQ
jgi:hypothetical protein